MSAVQTPPARIHKSVASRGRGLAAAFGGVYLGGVYPAASIIALALVTATDVSINRVPYDARFAFTLTGLVIGVGALHGVAWQLLQRLLGRLPRGIAGAFWLLASLLAGFLLVGHLGGFSRLGGRYRWLAVAVVAGCSIGAIGFGALLAALQPGPGAPRGWLGHARARVRLPVALLIAASAAGCGFADRILYPGLYPLAHLALRLASFLLVMLAIVICERELRLPRFTLGAALAIAALAAVPVAVLDEHDTPTLQVFGVQPWATLVLSTARVLTDVDADGYSSLLGGGDCAPFNHAIHPAAREIPNNGIDDNCMMGDAKPVKEGEQKLPMASGPSPMDVVLITIDSLRPDHVGVFNPAYRKPDRRTTPRLDEWAKKATAFSNAYTSGGWTSVALPSLMRGLFPRRLRWTYYYETNWFEMIRKPLEPKLRPGEFPDRVYPLAFDDPAPPLARRLQHRGMRTIGVVDDGYSQIFQRSGGAATGFDTFLEIDREPRARRGNQGVIDLAIAQLHKVRSQRFFLWVHLFGVHGGDERYPGVPVFGNSAVDRYDHEIAGLDPDLNRLLVALEQRAPPVAVFVTSDHGEDLKHVPRNHGYNLDDDVIRVPLIARVPGWPARYVDAPVSVVDLVPTILALTQTPVATSLDGRDMGPLAHGIPQPPRALFADTWQLDAKANRNLELVAAFDAHDKVVYDRKQHLMLVHERDRRRGGRLESNAIDALSRAVRGYLDETGGELRTRD